MSEVKISFTICGQSFSFEGSQEIADLLMDMWLSHLEKYYGISVERSKNAEENKIEIKEPKKI